MARAEHPSRIAAKAIDSYVAAREAPASSTDVVPVDARLEAVVERMFERCERDGEYKQVSRNPRPKDDVS